MPGVSAAGLFPRLCAVSTWGARPVVQGGLLRGILPRPGVLLDGHDAETRPRCICPPRRPLLQGLVHSVLGHRFSNENRGRGHGLRGPPEALGWGPAGPGPAPVWGSLFLYSCGLRQLSNQPLDYVLRRCSPQRH